MKLAVGGPVAPVGEAIVAAGATVEGVGTAVEITTSELAIEAFYPADRETARALGVG